jgi:hypothetical protein
MVENQNMFKAIRGSEDVMKLIPNLGQEKEVPFFNRAARRRLMKEWKRTMKKQGRV